MIISDFVNEGWHTPGRKTHNTGTAKAFRELKRIEQ